MCEDIMICVHGFHVIRQETVSVEVAESSFSYPANEIGECVLRADNRHAEINQTDERVHCQTIRCQLVTIVLTNRGSLLVLKTRKLPKTPTESINPH